MDKKLSLSRNTLYNTVGSCFYLVCQWLVTVAAGRLGSVETGGILTLAMSVTNLFFSLSTFGYRTYQVSDWAGKYTTGQYVTTRVMTCGCALALCGLYSILNPAYTGYEAACIAVYMLFRAGEALSDEHQAVQQTAERMDYVCWSFVMRGVLLLGSFSAVLALTHDLLTAFGAMTVSTLAVVVFYEYPVCRRLKPFRMRFESRFSLRLLGENLPLMLNSLLMTACVSIPRTALQALWGNWWMGIYGFIAAPAAVVQSAALWLFTPSLTAFSQYWNEGRRQDFYRLHRRILLLMAGVTVLILIGAKVLGRWGLNLLFGAEVAAQEALLLPTLATTMLIALEYYFSSLLTVVRSLRMILISNAAGAALTLALSRAMIRPMGAGGVNAVICIAMGVTVIMQGIALGVELRRRLGKTDQTA